MKEKFVKRVGDWKYRLKTPIINGRFNGIFQPFKDDDESYQYINLCILDNENNIIEKSELNFETSKRHPETRMLLDIQDYTLHDFIHESYNIWQLGT